MMEKAKNKVLLVAVGGIGFRHFQALLTCKSDFELHVVDVSIAAIERAKEYAEGQTHDKIIYYHASVSELEETSLFQLAIIATSSLQRREVFEEITARCIVQTLIFEKVLFPSIDDYEKVERLLKEKHITAYVNCTRRVQPVYKSLHEELLHAKSLCAHVKGSNWGLACNSIHMIDLFAYLISANLERVSCNGSLLEKKIFNSKRKGYIEFYGKMTGSIGDNISYLIECDHGEAELVIELTTESDHYSINESDGVMIKRHLHGGKPIEQHFEFLLVSQVTAYVADKLLQGKPVGLVSYEDSAKLHLPILRELLKTQNEILKSESTVCPIT